MRCNQATRAKKCLKKYVSQYFLIMGCFTAKQGIFVIPCKCADSCYQSSAARLLPN
jgi:hypothetical protein